MKKKLLLLLLAVLCIAAAAGKVLYDRQKKEAFVEEWVANGEATAKSYREQGVDGYQVRSGALFNEDDSILITPYYDSVIPDIPARIPAARPITRLPADEDSDHAVQSILRSMELIWMRDETITTMTGIDFFDGDTPRLILTQNGNSQEFALTLTEEHGLLTQAHRVASGVGLFLEFSVDRTAAQYLLERISTT